MSCDQYQDGINVIGHLSSSSGLGNSARLLIATLKARGFKLAGLDVRYESKLEPKRDLDLPIVETVHQLPYRNNLVVVSIQLLPTFWRGVGAGLVAPRFRNAGVVFWELPGVPKAWWPSLAMFDAIIAFSPYVRSAVELAVPDVPTFLAEHPLPRGFVPADARLIRAAYGIAEDAFVCSTSFDLRSTWVRKNPNAVVDAFVKAFPDDEHVRLLIKTNPGVGESASPQAAALLDVLNHDPRVVIVDRNLDYFDVLSLYGCADVFISLHRSEGLGLGLAEAMLLGRLVVATGYSGNMAFMSHFNSVPVPYRLVPPVKSGWQYLAPFAGTHAYWAEPDVSKAAFALRNARDDPVARTRLAARGAAEMQERQEVAWKAEYIDELLVTMHSSGRAFLRPKLLRKIYAAEVFDVEMLRQNIRGVLWKLQTR